MENFDLILPYEKYIKAIGFDDYMIDFSDISDEDAVELCEKIKEIIIRKNREKD